MPDQMTGAQFGADEKRHELRRADDKAFAALRESDARFRAAFATAFNGMGIADLEGRFLKANAALCTMTGYSEDELLGMNFQKITHPDDLEADLGFVQQMIDGEIPSFQMEKRYIRKDGTIVPILLSVALVRDSEGRPLYTVSQILDLTQQKEMDQKLFQAQKMEAIGQLTGGLAHDFNNLLAIILGNLQLLDKTLAGNDAALVRTGNAMDAAHRGAQLTQRLLAYSRRQILKGEVCNPNDHIHDMQELLSGSIGEAITMETQLSDDSWLVNVDSNQFETAILNLALNARDAMPDGGRLIIKTENVTLGADYTGAHPDVEPGQYVAISVTDTGFGMPEDVVAQVFEPFFTTKDVGVGTGLGLSMVFGFSKQSLGHIDLQSTEGQGTTVTMYLPREINEHSADRLKRSTERGDDPGGSETVLVVEDNDGVRDVSVSMLDQLGYTIVQAKSGVEALNVLSERDDIALVFTDIVMPEHVSGSELAAKALEIQPDMAFVFTSGFVDGAAMPQIQGTAFLSKPFSISDLANAIRDALDGGAAKSHRPPAA